MTPENFVYWLQGYFELQDAYVDKRNTLRVEHLDETQVQVIKDHLKLVFEKKTPQRSISDHLKTGLFHNCQIELNAPQQIEVGTPILDNRPFIPVSC